MIRASDLNDYPRPVPVILGGVVNGLGLARSFGAGGIPAVLVDFQKAVCYYSRYVRSYLGPNPSHHPEECADHLMEIAADWPAGGWLLSTKDEYLEIICRYRDRLSTRYTIAMSPGDVIDRIVNKRQAYLVAEQVGIRVPAFQTVTPGDFRASELNVPLPLIVKPSNPTGVLDDLAIRQKTFTANTLKELRDAVNTFRAAGWNKHELLLQRMIPGDAASLYTVTSYSDTQGRVSAYSCGHKIRQWLPNAGTIMAGRLHMVPEIVEMTRRFCRATGFHGIANTEFKRHPETGEFYFIEMNPRPGKWNCVTLASGINMPLIAYRESLGERYEGPQVGRHDLVWWGLEDVLWYLVGVVTRRHRWNPAGYFESICGRKVFPIMSLKDPVPTLGYLLHVCGIAVKPKAWGRLLQMSRKR